MTEGLAETVWERAAVDTDVPSAGIADARSRSRQIRSATEAVYCCTSQRLSLRLLELMVSVTYSASSILDELGRIARRGDKAIRKTHEV